MPRDQADAWYLWDMLTAAKAVADFTRDRTFQEYSNDLMLRSPVERQVEIIGEAARRATLPAVFLLDGKTMECRPNPISPLQLRPVHVRRPVLQQDEAACPVLPRR